MLLVALRMSCKLPQDVRTCNLIPSTLQLGSASRYRLLPRSPVRGRRSPASSPPASTRAKSRKPPCLNNNNLRNVMAWRKVVFAQMIWDRFLSLRHFPLPCGLYLVEARRGWNLFCFGESSMCPMATESKSFISTEWVRTCCTLVCFGAPYVWKWASRSRRPNRHCGEDGGNSDFFG